MYDSFDRKINYLRISVTDRCNLRCIYCMPEEGIKMLQHNEVLSFEEIDEITRIAVSMGVNKVRITGESLLWEKELSVWLKCWAKLKESLTFQWPPMAYCWTNMLHCWKSRTSPYKCESRQLKSGKIQETYPGATSAMCFQGLKLQKSGTNPIKINCVVQKSSEEPDAVRVADYCHRNGLQVRFIHQMSLTEGHFSVVEGAPGRLQYMQPFKAYSQRKTNALPF